MHELVVFFIAGKIVPYLENTVAQASIITILAISFERYYATCQPLVVLYRCTNSRAVKIIGAVWVCAMISTSPMIFMSYLSNAIFVDGTPVKICRTPIDRPWKEVYVLGVILIFFVVPIITLTALYILIAKRLMRGRLGFQRNITLHPEREQIYRAEVPQTTISRKKVIHMLMIVIVVFFICLLPIRIVTLWFVYSSVESKEDLGLEGWLNLITFARIMLYANSAINPVIYNIVSTKFREAFMRTLRFRPSIMEMRRMSIVESSQMTRTSYVCKHSQLYQTKMNQNNEQHSITKGNTSWTSVPTDV